MRPLKRPMFKYGGDVKKQGIMHGMNGLRDGGVATTMADATGYAGGGGVVDKTKNYIMNNKLKLAGYGSSVPAGIEFLKYLFAPGMKNGGKAALVGNPVFPIGPDGRAMHAEYFNIGGQNVQIPDGSVNRRNVNLYGSGKNFIKNVPKSSGQVVTKIAKAGAKKFLPKNFLKGAGTKGLDALKNFYNKRITIPKDRPAMERAGNFVRNNKLLTGAGLVYAPPVVGGIYSAAEKIVPPVASFLTPDYIENPIKKGYGAVKKALGFEDKKVPPPGEGGPGSNVPDAVINPPKTQAQIDAEIKANEDKRLNKIYSLLGVDRAKKNAAAKALADMSRYIDEGGKDTISRKNIGSTLTKGILAFDKRLDKVDQLKEAAGLMQAKGMIEKDIRSSDNELKELQKQKIRNDLTKKFADLKMVSKIPGQKGYNTAAATASEDYRGNLITQTDLSDMIEKVKDKEGILDETVIIENITNETIKDKNIADGDYTVGDSLVTVEKGKVTAVLR